MKMLLQLLICCCFFQSLKSLRLSSPMSKAYSNSRFLRKSHDVLKQQSSLRYTTPMKPLLQFRLKMASSEVEDDVAFYEEEFFKLTKGKDTLTYMNFLNWQDCQEMIEEVRYVLHQIILNEMLFIFPHIHLTLMKS